MEICISYPNIRITILSQTHIAQKETSCTAKAIHFQPPPKKLPPKTDEFNRNKFIPHFQPILRYKIAS